MIINSESGRIDAALYQDSEMNGIGEPAILIADYSGSDLIELRQEDNRINVNLDSLPELCKQLLKMRQQILSSREREKQADAAKRAAQEASKA